MESFLFGKRFAWSSCTILVIYSLRAVINIEFNLDYGQDISSSRKL